MTVKRRASTVPTMKSKWVSLEREKKKYQESLGSFGSLYRYVFPFFFFSPSPLCEKNLSLTNDYRNGDLHLLQFIVSAEGDH